MNYYKGYIQWYNYDYIKKIWNIKTSGNIIINLNQVKPKKTDIDSCLVTQLPPTEANFVTQSLTRITRGIFSRTSSPLFFKFPLTNADKVRRSKYLKTEVLCHCSSLSIRLSCFCDWLNLHILPLRLEASCSTLESKDPLLVQTHNWKTACDKSLSYEHLRDGTFYDPRI